MVKSLNVHLLLMYVMGLGEREIVKHLMTFALSLIINLSTCVIVSDLQVQHEIRPAENVQCQYVHFKIWLISVHVLRL